MSQEPTRWEQLGQPTVEAMLEEISGRDANAGALAGEVWTLLRGRTQQERDVWREQLATAVLSYRGSFQRSRIATIATQKLRELGVNIPH